MNLEELYNRITNPLDIPTVERLIEIFGSNLSFYNGLSKGNGLSNKERVLQKDYDRVRNELFDKWKDKFLSITKEEANELYRKGLIDKDFVEMRNFVVKHKDITTDKEFSNLAFKDAKMEDIYDKYKWDSIDSFGAWTFFTNDLITSKKRIPFTVEHRLYINPSAKDTYDFANIFRKKCEEANLPYYFKISDSPVRDDKIVIYCDTAHIEPFLRILNTIRKENPDIMSRMNKPPLLSGKIGFIGYGSEPLPKNGKLRSFNEVRSNVIEKAIAKEICSWYTRNKDLKQGDCTLEDAIVKECTRKVINEMTKKYNYAVEYYTSQAKKNGTGKITEAFIISKVGFGAKELDSPRLYKAVEKAVRETGLKCIYDGSLYDQGYMTMLNIPLESGQIYYGPLKDIKDVIATSLPGIIKFDKTFAPRVKKTITEELAKENVVPDKICFDVDKKAMFTKSTSKVDSEDSVVEKGFPTFKELRSLATKYRVSYDVSVKKIRIYDIATGKEETNTKVAQDALFANIWLTSAGMKITSGEKRPGLIYAFNEGSRQLYNYFIKASKYSIEKTGDLNSMYLFKNADKVNYKYSEDIIARLFRSDYQSIFLDNYVQNRVNSSLPRNKRAQTLFDTEAAYNMLSNNNQNKTKK